MILTYQDRLRIERRLLAALFLWPTECDLDPQHFHAPEHSWLFMAIQEVKRAPVSDDVLATTFDDTALANIALWFMDHQLDSYFNSAGGFFKFASAFLQQSGDTRAEIPALIAEVRECPRCGR